MIFRKSDREILESIAHRLNREENAYIERCALNDVRWKLLHEGLDRLIQSHAALEAVVIAHDKWCKDYNATVEARNAEVSALHKKAAAEHEEWKSNQMQAVRYVLRIFDEMNAKMDAAIAVRKPKPAKQQRRKKAA